MEDYTSDFFTTTYPPAEWLVCYHKIAAVPRLKEIVTWLNFMLGPLIKIINDIQGLSTSEKIAIVDYILNGDWEGLKDYIETLYPSVPPATIEAAVQEYLYGYYHRSIAQAASLCKDIIISEYEYLYAGMTLQYKTSYMAEESEIVTIDEDYILERYDLRTLPLGEFVYEYYLEMWFHNVEYDRSTWEDVKWQLEYFQSLYGGVLIYEIVSHGGVPSTQYALTLEWVFDATIGGRVLNFSDLEHVYYSHYVEPALVFATDPDTRGGIYSAYFGEEWSKETEHPDTMGNPWPGDEDEKPYPEEYYDWENITVNPPGFTRETAYVECHTIRKILWIGEGEDPGPPSVPLLPSSPISGPLGGGKIHTPLKTLSPLAAIFRRLP